MFRTLVALPLLALAASAQSSCSKSYTVVSGDNCYKIINKQSGLTLPAFYALNPSINSACTNLNVGQSICLVGGGSSSSGSSGSSSGTSATSSSPAASASSGASCATYVTVKSGDTCYRVSSAAGIALDTLYQLNPSIDSGCQNLMIGQQVCVKAGAAASSTRMMTTVVRSSTTSSSAAAATSSAAASSGSGSGKTYTVVSGDNCYKISNAAGISLQTLYSLNPSISSGCTNLNVGQVVVVSAGAGSTSSTGAPSTTSSSSSAPAATTTAPATDDEEEDDGTCIPCEKSYTVASGDYCSKIANQFGITVDDLLWMNEEIDDHCQNLLIGQVVCVA